MQGDGALKRAVKPKEPVAKDRPSSAFTPSAQPGKDTRSPAGVPGQQDSGRLTVSGPATAPTSKGVDPAASPSGQGTPFAIHSPMPSTLLGLDQLKGLGSVMGAHGPLLGSQAHGAGLASGVTDAAQLQQLMTLSMLQGNASLPLSSEHLAPGLHALGTMGQAAGVLGTFGAAPLSPHDLAMRQLPLNPGLLAGLNPGGAAVPPAALQGVSPSILSNLSGARLPESELNRLVRNMLVGGAASVNGLAGAPGVPGPLGLQALSGAADRSVVPPQAAAPPGAGAPLSRSLTPPAGLGSSAHLSSLSQSLPDRAAPIDAVAGAQDVTQLSPFMQANAFTSPLDGANHLGWLGQAGLRPEDAGSIDRRRSFPRATPSNLGRSMLRNSSYGVPMNTDLSLDPQGVSVGRRSSFTPVGLASDRPTSFSPVLKAGDAPATSKQTSLNLSAAKAAAGSAQALMPYGSADKGPSQPSAEAAPLRRAGSGPARPASATQLKSSSRGAAPNAASDAPSKGNKSSAAAAKDAPGAANPAADAAPKIAAKEQHAGAQGGGKDAAAQKAAGDAQHCSRADASGVSFGLGGAWSKSMDISEVLRSVREGQRNGDATRSKVHALMPVSKDWEDEVCIGSGGSGSVLKGPRAPDAPARPPSAGRERSAVKRSRDTQQPKNAAPHDQAPAAQKGPSSVGDGDTEPQIDRNGIAPGSRRPVSKRTRLDVRGPSGADGSTPPLQDNEQQSVQPQQEPAPISRSSKKPASGLMGTEPARNPADELQRAGQAWLASDPRAAAAAPDDAIIMALLLSPHLAERTRAASLVLSDPVKYARFAVLAAQCLTSASAAGVPVGVPGAIGPQMHVPPFPSIKGLISPPGALPQPATSFPAVSSAGPPPQAGAAGDATARSASPSVSEAETLRALVNMHGTLNGMYDYFISQKTTHMNELHRLIASAANTPSATSQAEDKEDENAAVRAILKSASIMRASHDQEAIAQAEAAAPQGADMMGQRLNALNSLVTLSRLQSSSPAPTGVPALAVGPPPPLAASIPNGLGPLDPAYSALLVQQAMLAGRSPSAADLQQQAFLQGSGQLAGLPVVPPLASEAAAGVLPGGLRFGEPLVAGGGLQGAPTSGSPATAGPMPTAESDVGMRRGASASDVRAGSAPSKSTHSRGACAANGTKSAFQDSQAAGPSSQDPPKSGA